MDEKKDERVDFMAEMIKTGFKWGSMNWDFQEEADEPIAGFAGDIASGDDDDEAEEFMTPNTGVSSSSSYVKKKKKFPDVGAETRKKKVLCQRFAATQRSAATQMVFDEDMEILF
ncbi:unnamed protein product [Eruca vesicaria subsp. sativa]|uniref:Uncharacterized protein n=1 Tax=Eruca vesicaria subsp. sativa TaxID=29727 RepID=A0ABC8KAX5_ERUVS|nr:unnamed protein product [Eruca vesicaria subsp. sativa]